MDAVSLSVIIPHENCEWTDSKTTCGLSISSDTILTGHDDGSVTIWKIHQDKIQVVSVLQPCSKFPVVSLVPFKTSNLTRIAIVQSDGTLSVFSASGFYFESSNLRLLTGAGTSRSACVFGDGKYLAAIGQSASVLVIDLTTMSPTHLLHGHEDWVSSVTAIDETSTSCLLVSCSDDGIIHVWRWREINQRESSFASGIIRIKTLFPSSSPTPSSSSGRYKVVFSPNKFHLFIVTSKGECGYLTKEEIDSVSKEASLKVHFLENNILDCQFLENGDVSLLRKDCTISLYRLKENHFQYDTVIKSSFGKKKCCLTNCETITIISLQDSSNSFAISRSNCQEDIIDIYRSGQLYLSGKKSRYTSSHESLMVVLVAPPRLSLLPTLIVKEQDNGNIGISCFPDLPNSTSNVSNNKKKITSMACFQSWNWNEGKIRVLLVGRKNGYVDIFRIQVPHLFDDDFQPKLDVIASMKTHFGMVTGFSSPPPSSSSSTLDRFSKLFCSVGADNEVVVFHLKEKSLKDEKDFEVTCLLRLNGHHSPVRSIYWDIPASSIHVRCDKTFVWNIRSGCLERRSANSLDFSFRQASRSYYSAGAVLFTHIPTSLISGTFEGDTCPDSNYSTPRRLDPATDLDADDSYCTSIEFPVKSRTSPPINRFGTLFEFDLTDLTEALRKILEKGDGKKCAYACSGALSLLHEWDLDPEIDRVCINQFGMSKPQIPVKFVHKQNFPFLTTTLIVSSKRWSSSEILTASQNLGLVVLFLNCTTFQRIPNSVSEIFSQLVTAYGIKFPDVFRTQNCWKEPSLPYLAKRALVLEKKEENPSGIHIAARLLLQRTIERMPMSERTCLVQDWSARVMFLREIFQNQMNASTMIGSSSTPPLPQQQPRSKSAPGAIAASTPNLKRTVGTQSELSSLESESFVVDEETVMDEKLRNLILTNPEYQLLVLLLATVGVVHAEDLNPTTARLVTETLVEAVALTNRFHQGMGSTIDRVYSSSSVAQFIQHQIRKVNTHTDHRITTLPDIPVAINPAFAAELLAKGFSLFRPHIPHMSRLIKRLLILTTESDDFPQRATAAERCLSEVGSAHPVLFIRTIGVEVCKRDSSDSYRSRALEALINLVKKFPLAFLRHLPLVAEIVIKTLDPSEPTLRQSCLAASTKALHELVKRYPMVSFHQTSQRFAVGTVESTIIVYDLRTATKWRILDGSEGAISAVAFEKDGERMASYSASEKSVRLWATRSPGIFGGLLTIRGTFLFMIPLEPVIGTVNEMSILRECRLEWVSPTEIKLKRESGGQTIVLKVTS